MANLNKLKKIHFLYKTTNLLNGKFYVGIHSTNNTNDGYLGSGKKLKRSINKYGKENFKIDILEVFESRDLLIEKERELVNTELLKDPQCMNLKPGGQGGTCGQDHILKLKKGASEYQKKMWKNDEYRNKIINVLRNNLVQNHKLGRIKYDTFTGKKHVESTKRKMSDSKKGKGVGESNSQFGTCWITNGVENKKIKKTEDLPKGWEFGRKLYTS
jgi:group I intron endonuclease